jgi:hypothetical protein
MGKIDNARAGITQALRFTTQVEWMHAATMSGASDILGAAGRKVPPVGFEPTLDGV